MAVDAFLLLLGMIALGKLAAKTGRFPESAGEVLNRFVIDICLPAAVLRYASRLELDASLFQLVAVPWLLCAATEVGVLLVARRVALSAAHCRVSKHKMSKRSYLQPPSQTLTRY